MHPQHFVTDPTDIRIRVNTKIRIRMPDQDSNAGSLSVEILASPEVCALWMLLFSLSLLSIIVCLFSNSAFEPQECNKTVSMSVAHCLVSVNHKNDESRFMSERYVVSYPGTSSARLVFPGSSHQTMQQQRSGSIRASANCWRPQECNYNGRADCRWKRVQAPWSPQVSGFA